MKAISLWQPFASAIPFGLKRMETRHWSTNYRGPLVIHAAKKRDKTLDAIARQGGLDPDQLPYGQVIATCKLLNVMPTEIMKFGAHSMELHFGDFNPDRFAWILFDVNSIKPFPFKGGQGFFNVPDELLQ